MNGAALAHVNSIRAIDAELRKSAWPEKVRTLKTGTAQINAARAMRASKGVRCEG